MESPNIKDPQIMWALLRTFPFFFLFFPNLPFYYSLKLVFSQHERHGNLEHCYHIFTSSWSPKKDSPNSSLKNTCDNLMRSARISTTGRNLYHSHGSCRLFSSPHPSWATFSIFVFFIQSLVPEVQAFIWENYPRGKWWGNRLRTKC